MNITKLTGVGAKRAHSLYNSGICTVADLLNHFPRDYDDRSQVGKTVAELMPDAVNTLRGTIAADPESASIPRKGAPALTLTKLLIKDHTGTLEIVWFNQPYLKKYFKRGGEYIFTGKVREIGGKLQMQSPEYEPCGNVELSHGRIVPVYTTPKQFSQKTFRALIHQALDVGAGYDAAYAEYLPAAIRDKYSLRGRKTAIQNIHFPESDALFLAARRRLVFEELFFVQSALQQLKDAVTSQPGIVIGPSPCHCEEGFKPTKQSKQSDSPHSGLLRSARNDEAGYHNFISALPFPLTNAQIAVLADIQRDMTSGKRMNRLVQGDVGSGKTVVAMAAAYLVMQAGYQAALMVPTEVLASQHYSQCKQFFEPLGFETVLLTGSLGAKERRESLAKIQNGQAKMIIGTHALIQEKVNYAHLGLAITDEQHRFGVNQRLNLTEKGIPGQAQNDGRQPHTLVMTATPIPRTLGMILYGDLDISIINELPPGRQTIKTYSVSSKYQQRVHGFIRAEIEAGRQAYIICPAIEARETDENQENPDQLKNVLDYTAELRAALPDIKIAHLHGKMKPAEKQEIMDAFKAGDISVLVSTTVIEVGVHVANATLMIIENAERFGLSQLHQLRGRVGRGQHQSYCVLITDTKAQETKARMKAMCDTADGFVLAELDLKIRGAGDFFGTRQHGLPTFAIANLYRDMDVLKDAQQAILDMQEMQISEEERTAMKQRLSRVLHDTYGGVM